MGLCFAPARLPVVPRKAFVLATNVAAEEFLERCEGKEGELAFSLPEGGMARDVTT